METQFVTEQDYLNRYGTDLNVELASFSYFEGAGSPASSFIAEIEDLCLLELKFRYDSIPSTDYQKEYFKKAVLCQVKYVLMNGDIYNESGYNQQTGQLVPREELEKIGFASEFWKYCKVGALCNIQKY